MFRKTARRRVGSRSLGLVASDLRQEIKKFIDFTSVSVVLRVPSGRSLASVGHGVARRCAEYSKNASR